MKQGPCYNCPTRNIGCHSACENYAAYRQMLDSYNLAKRRADLGRDLCAEMRRERDKRIKGIYRPYKGGQRYA